MKTAKILIVDDEKNILKTLSKALEPFEYEIDLAESGSEACNKIAHQTYDCIILDLRLPDMDGLEILRLHNPPNVIMITAHGTIDNAVEAMKLGCVDFIQKPFDLEVVRDTVTAVLSRKNLAFEQELKYESYVEAAKLEVGQRHYRLAMEQINKALELKPDSAEAFNFLGVMHEILGDLTNAMKAYQTAHKLNPTYSPALENIERVLKLDINAGIVLGLDR